MARRLFSNNAQAVTGSVLSASGTSFTITGDYVDNFPVPGPEDIVHISVQSVGGALEIMKMTDRSADVVTVERAKEGTIPQNFQVGALVEVRLTADALNAFAQKDADESVIGNWTFSGDITVPLVPATPGSAASKQYVGDQIAASQGVTQGYVDSENEAQTAEILGLIIALG